MDDIFDGKVDLEYQLAAYNTKSFILLYSYNEIKEGFAEKNHAIAVKYSCKKKALVVRDSNLAKPWTIESQERIREWLAKVTKIEVIAFACVQSSTDPDAAIY